MPVAELNFAGECYHCGGGAGKGGRVAVAENNVARACVCAYVAACRCARRAVYKRLGR